jgi:hypothetical protein
MRRSREFNLTKSEGMGMIGLAIESFPSFAQDGQLLNTFCKNVPFFKGGYSRGVPVWYAKM